jgi:acetyl-CoA carboxylase biotin carboxyl carrier protein
MTSGFSRYVDERILDPRVAPDEETTANAGASGSVANAGSGGTAEDAGSGGSAAVPAGELVEQVRDEALRLLAQVPYPPTSIRIRVGQISLELEWQPPASGPASEIALSPGAVVLDGQGPTASSPPEPVGHPVRAPSVGVFYESPSPGDPAFVDVGDTVTAGQQVGIVEVMKLMIPVETDRSGVVVAVLKRNGDSVEYDEPLITITPIEG